MLWQSGDITPVEPVSEQCDSTELRKQQYERFKELLCVRAARYLDAGAILSIVQVVER